MSENSSVTGEIWNELSVLLKAKGVNPAEVMPFWNRAMKLVHRRAKIEVLEALMEEIKENGGKPLTHVSKQTAEKLMK